MSENTNVIKEAKKLITQLRVLCKKNNIPMFVTLCESRKPLTSEDSEDASENTYIENPVYYTEFVSPYNSKVILEPDYIAECIKIVNDFGKLNKSEAIRVSDLSVELPDAFKNV